MSFKFGQNVLVLNIVGTEYTIDPFGKGVLGAVTQFRGSLKDNDLVDLPCEENVIKVCEEVAKLVDGILGDGAYQHIFAGRTVNLLDHYELAMDLIAKITAFRATRITQFTQDGISSAEKMFSSQMTPTEAGIQ